MCGGVVMLMTGILLGAIVIEEKDKEIEYLKRKLYEQAKNESNGYRRNNKQDS